MVVVVVPAVVVVVVVVVNVEFVVGAYEIHVPFFFFSSFLPMTIITMTIAITMRMTWWWCAFDDDDDDGCCCCCCFATAAESFQYISQ